MRADRPEHARPWRDVHHAPAAAEAGAECRPGGGGPGALLPPDSAHLQSVQGQEQVSARAGPLPIN